MSVSKMGLTLLSICVVCVSSVVKGAEIPHSFQSGDRALASEVNENFEFLNQRAEENRQSLDELKETINYRDYWETPSISVKNFKYVNAVSGCESARFELTFDAQDETLQTERRTHFNADGDDCGFSSAEIFYQHSAEGLIFAGSNSSTQFVFTDPLFTLGGEMRFGVADASASIANYTTGAGDVALPDGAFTVGYELLSRDSVVIPEYGLSFDDCIKVSRDFNNVRRLDWFCRGVGLVKSFSGGNRAYILKSYE